MPLSRKGLFIFEILLQYKFDYNSVYIDPEET